MQIFAVIAFLVYIKFAVSVELKPGIPVPHAKVLDEIFTKYLGDSYSNNALFDFILGKQSNNTDANITSDNLDIKILDVDNVRKIINFAKKKHEQQEIAKSRRSNDLRRHQSYYWQRPINIRAMELMKHEIYLVKERVNTTVPFRNKYRMHHSYQIAVLHGAGTAILTKMESLLAQLNHFYWKTHFIWWLIVYEKMLACNIDITNIVERMFYTQKIFAKFRGPKPKSREQLLSMGKKPGAPTGALELALANQKITEQQKKQYQQMQKQQQQGK